MQNTLSNSVLSSRRSFLKKMAAAAAMTAAATMFPGIMFAEEQNRNFALQIDMVKQIVLCIYHSLYLF